MTGQGEQTEEDSQGSTGRNIRPETVQGEIEDFLRTHEQRRRQVPRAALVGLVAGLVAVAFRYSLAAGEAARRALIDYAHGHPGWGVLIPVLWGALGAGIAVTMVRRLAPEASGSGIPHLKAVLHHLRGMLWQRILPVKFLGGVAGISAGLALGREGPTIQMGGAVGQMIGRWLRVTARERQTLIAAGAGAGLAAAFNAPLSGLVFVLEEVQGDFSPSVFTAAFIASAIADVTARLLTGQLPVFHVESAFIPPLSSLPGFLVLGLVAAFLGVLFNRALVGSLNLFSRVQKVSPWLVGGAVGGAVGLIGWFFPDALGGGQELVQRALTARENLAALPALFLLRFALTMTSYGSGAPGGIFAPLLALGAQFGLMVGGIAHRLFPGTAPHPESFAAVGMGAYFTAIVRAPLTGIVLIVEMTGNYALILPLLIACLTAYGIADLLGDRPVYEALLERDLLRGQANPELEDTLLLELPIHHGAPFDGRVVRELGLPAGCVLVTVRRGRHEEVPTASTRLQAGDRITAVVSPQAAHAVPLLRAGADPGASQSRVLRQRVPVPTETRARNDDGKGAQYEDEPG